jgi:hypothetical protein
MLQGFRHWIAQGMPVTKALRRADIMFRYVHHAGEEAQQSSIAHHNSPKEQ